MGEPVAVVCGGLTGLPIPAAAEIVLEGHRHALGEWYIHGEDVRRVHDLPADPGDDTLQLGADAVFHKAHDMDRFIEYCSALA